MVADQVITTDFQCNFIAYEVQRSHYAPLSNAYSALQPFVSDELYPLSLLYILQHNREGLQEASA
eukprot:XP_001710161.1 Hypothetical protein GL50803_7387 [Giardia lamblia ATCC 50803]